MSVPSHSPADWRPLALTLAVVTAVYVVVYRLMPFDLRAVAPWPFFGWALYAGGRLTLRVAIPLVLGVVGLTDVILYQVYHLPPTVWFYPCLGLSLVLGWGLLRRSESPWLIAGGGMFGYGVFFLLTNFAAWLEPAMPDYLPHSAQTLALAYWRGLEFLRHVPGQLYGDVLFGLGLFGAHAYLAKAYFPAERVAAEGVR